MDPKGAKQAGRMNWEIGIDIYIAGEFFTNWSIRETQEYWSG